jgi:hypothetical protein
VRDKVTCYRGMIGRRGTERLRLTPSPLHSGNDIEALVAALTEVWPGLTSATLRLPRLAAARACVRQETRRYKIAQNFTEGRLAPGFRGATILQSLAKNGKFY